MIVAAHLENLKESIAEIQEAVKQGLLGKQRSIGFHASAGAIDMLEIILHERNLIDPGFIIKHEWFNSRKRVVEKFQFDFPRKSEMLDILIAIEGVRNKMCYGKRQGQEDLVRLVENFNRLKDLFKEVSGHEL